MPSIRPLHPDEINAAATTLAAAFDNDPLFRFLLPDASTRPQWLIWMHSQALREARTAQGALTIGAGPTVGAICLFPVDTWPPSMRQTIGAVGWPPGVPSLRLARWGMHIEGQCRKAHPKGKHVYIHVLGVAPQEKGRGFGGGLLRHACAMADEAGAFTHLETSNEVNLSLYQRFGFEVQTELTSHGGPPVWTMTRPRSQR